MNGKGWRSALGGLSAVVRTAAATGRKLYEHLSRIRPLFRFLPPPFPSLSFSLARISGGAVSKLFLRLAVKGRLVARCVYIRAYIKDRRRRAKVRPALNYAILRNSFRWIVTSPGLLGRDRRLRDAI